jgi:hypothetical protein
MVDFTGGGGVVGMPAFPWAQPDTAAQNAAYFNNIANVGAINQAALNPTTLYGAGGFGGMTDAYSAAGAAYGRATGGFQSPSAWPQGDPVVAAMRSNPAVSDPNSFYNQSLLTGENAAVSDPNSAYNQSLRGGGSVFDVGTSGYDAYGNPTQAWGGGSSSSGLGGVADEVIRQLGYNPWDPAPPMPQFQTPQAALDARQTFGGMSPSQYFSGLTSPQKPAYNLGSPSWYPQGGGGSGGDVGGVDPSIAAEMTRQIRQLGYNPWAGQQASAPADPWGGQPYGTAAAQIPIGPPSTPSDFSNRFGNFPIGSTYNQSDLNTGIRSMQDTLQLLNDALGTPRDVPTSSDTLNQQDRSVPYWQPPPVSPGG